MGIAICGEEGFLTSWFPPMQCWIGLLGLAIESLLCQFVAESCCRAQNQCAGAVHMACL